MTVLAHTCCATFRSGEAGFLLYDGSSGDVGFRDLDLRAGNVGESQNGAVGKVVQRSSSPTPLLKWAHLDEVAQELNVQKRFESLQRRKL